MDGIPNIKAIDHRDSHIFRKIFFSSVQKVFSPKNLNPRLIKSKNIFNFLKNWGGLKREKNLARRGLSPRPPLLKR